MTVLLVLGVYACTLGTFLTDRLGVITALVGVGVACLLGAIDGAF
ncbi:MAG: hypothetical protein AB7P99_19185 [Vicinamibacterales bacterium]